MGISWVEFQFPWPLLFRNVKFLKPAAGNGATSAANKTFSPKTLLFEF